MTKNLLISSKREWLGIYDGSSITSPMITHELCGSKSPTTIFSHKNELFIRFHSKRYENNSKFKFQVKERGKSISNNKKYLKKNLKGVMLILMVSCKNKIKVKSKFRKSQVSMWIQKRRSCRKWNHMWNEWKEYENWGLRPRWMVCWKLHRFILNSYEDIV